MVLNLVVIWLGYDDYVKKCARMLAKQGYTAFALDMYGNGKQTAHLTLRFSKFLNRYW